MSQTNRNDASRLWVQKNLNRMAISRALEQIQSTGRALPCKVQSVSGQIVTVTFDVQSDVWTLPPVTIPIATAVYDWIPVQVGDPGITMPCDVAIGPISGLGGNQAVLGQSTGNLSSLMFVPVSNAALTPPGGDPNKRVVQGIKGFLVQSISAVVSMLGDVSAGLQLAFNAVTLALTSSGITATVGSTTEVIESSAITWTTPTATVDGNFIVSGTITGNGSGGATMAGAISSSQGVSGATLSAGNGATGSFTASSGQTITVVSGIITGIS